MLFPRMIAVSAVVSSLIACSGTDSTPSPAAGDGGSTTPPSNGAVDAGSSPRDSAAPPPAPSDAAAEGGIVIDPDAGTATLVGNISRTAALGAGLDGKGTLFIAVMDKNPVTDRANAKSLGNALVRDADLSGAASKVAFRMEGVPVVNADLFIIAFFDDNGNADTSGDGSKAGPDKGDLVNLDLTNPLKVRVDHAGEIKVDVVLNAGLPF